MSTKRLSNRELFAYSLPEAVVSLMVVPVIAILPTLYVENTTVGLAATGTILLFSRIFDAVSDQVIGYISDRTLSARGGRKLWLIAGTIVSIFAVANLFFPEPDVGVIYFGTWTLIFYLGWTMISIPYMAWGAELSSFYHDRTKIATARGFIGQIGNFLFLASPILFFYLNITDSTEMTLKVINLVGLIVCVALPVAVGIAVIFTRPGVVHAPSQNNVKIGRFFNSIRKNSLFMRYLLAYILAGVGYGMFATLLFPYLKYHLDLSEQYSYISAAMSIGGLVSIPIWLRISYLLGKHRSWAWGWLFQASSLLMLLFVPTENVSYPIVFISITLYGFFAGASIVVPPSILADIVDYGRLKQGGDGTGSYFALHMFVTKLSFAFGGGLAFLLLNLFNYEIGQDVINDDTAKLGMTLVFIGIPVFLQLCAVPLIWNFPLNHRRQKIIRKRLEIKDIRAQREAE